MARILLIEDNLANLELMAYLLSAFGHAPQSAVDGAAGIAAARSSVPDLIVCDIQLPGIDGFAVARALKAEPALRAVALVAVTALAMVGDRDQILAAGFDGYLSKPLVPETFVGQLEAFLPPAQRNAQALPPTHIDVHTPATTSAPTRATILVVDDQQVNRELLRTILEPFGYIVVLAENVPQAQALAHIHQPELIVTDMHMPGLDGFDLIRAVKADPLLQDIKILISSATIGSEQDCREALRLGALKCITRPIEPHMILAEVETCLTRKEECCNGDDTRS